MTTMIDTELVQEFKDRIAERYTAAELVDLLDVPVEDIIEEYWSKIFNSGILEEVGANESFASEWRSHTLEEEDDALH